MSTYKIAFLPGDHIGQEISPVAESILNWFTKKTEHSFEIEHGLIGGAAYDIHGEPFPDVTKRLVDVSDAVFLGAVGGPEWEGLPLEKRPEVGGILAIRKYMGVYANLRPGFILPGLERASSLKEDLVKGFDLLIVRELLSGIYFGEKGRDGDTAWDKMAYSRHEIERIVRIAFDAARKRRKKLCMVDKSNVLESSRLWREVTGEIAKDYADVEYSQLYVDNAAMQLVRASQDFDVIVTANLFGDILSDLVGSVTGSIGVLPSASLSDSKGLYEPMHGSAPDIAGQGKANPIASILSIGMMLKYAFGLNDEHDMITHAVERCLKKGIMTSDIAPKSVVPVSTTAFGEAVLNEMSVFDQMGKKKAI